MDATQLQVVSEERDLRIIIGSDDLKTENTALLQLNKQTRCTVLKFGKDLSRILYSNL